MIKSIKIGLHTIKVVEFDTEESDISGNNGYYCANTLTIGMYKELDKSKYNQILLHEILHAIYGVYGLDDNRTEEDYAELTSTGLLMLFKDNPKLYKQLIK